MKVYDYHCSSCGDTWEMFVANEHQDVFCKCGGHALRMTPTPQLRYLQMGVDPTMTTSADKWDKARAQEMKREQRIGICEEE